MPPPSNKLAPAPVNKLDALMAEMAKYPQYGEVVDYLTQRGKMPAIALQYLGDGVNARFSRNTVFGNELPKAGLVEIDRTNPRASSLLHELTHAADIEMGNHAYDLEFRTPPSKLTPQEKRFLDSYKKGILNMDLRSDNPAHEPRQETANKLSPEWAKKNRSYRASRAELPAWGMGSTIEPSADKGYVPPQHLDPTMATEFLILMDSARRANRK